MSETRRPRLSILAAEDDPILGRFLVDALAGAGHAVRLATTGHEALAAARAERFDLLLVDQQLPDVDGALLLARLRADPDAASHRATAIAMSGDLPSDRRAALRSIGYAEAWQKPLSLSTLEAIDRLGGADAASDAVTAATAAADLDDTVALSRLGSETTVRALRGLLAGELPRQWRTITDALDGGDVALALATLHRARAGCALCGASAAAAALAALEDALRTGAEAASPRQHADAAVARVVARLATASTR